MEQCRLIYRSTSTDEVPSNEDLQDLAEVAVKNNQRDGITGLLLLSGSTFLQVLEGPSQKLSELFQRISRDPRHHKIELVQFQPVSESYFEDWDMRLVDLYDLPMEKRRLFMDKYECDDDAVLIPDKIHLIFSLLLDARAVCKDGFETS